MVGETHLIDLMYESGKVDLVALFGPEHGLRGTTDDGVAISDGRDPKTGLPVFSLYGQNRRPTPESLKNVDALVFDIQDVGARFYTFISTMGLSMQSAAAAQIPFFVLDRPNPLNGDLVSGFVLDPDFSSFVGQYPIPVAHGLTVGELARMIKGESWLSGLETLDLRVVKMEGWQREMQWPDTGLEWIATSPNIPDFETSLVYPGMCFFEGTAMSEGRGTLQPFKQVGAPWANGEEIAADLNSRGIPGVDFHPIIFTPQSISGMSSNPKLKGRELQGIRMIVTDRTIFEPVAAGIHVLQAFYSRTEGINERNFFKPDWLGKLSGSQRLYQMLVSGASPEQIVSAWKSEVDDFRDLRSGYLLY